MNKKHLTDTASHHSNLQLKPLVIAISTALGMAGLLTGCFGGGNDNDGGGNAVGTFSVSAAGGIGGSTTGTGGSGGSVDLYAPFDNSSILVLTGGSDAVPDVTSWPSSPALGSNSLTISSNTTLDVTATEPASGTPYQAASSCNVYVSDGNGYGGDETPVTGIEVASGTTLTLEDNGLEFACVDLSNDLVNAGNITAGAGRTMNLTVEDYFGTGTVTSAGDATTPYGGDINIFARTSNYNAGSMTSKGFASSTVDGGEGGDIHLKGQGVDMWNSGVLDSSGGDSTAAGYGGGDGGVVTLYGYNNEGSNGGGTVISAGAIDSSGGNGPAGGGDGGNVNLYNWAAGDLYVTAGINMAGGNTTGTGGNGGSGGALYATTFDANSKMVFVDFKDITTAGGDGAEGGGSGGGIAWRNGGSDSSKYVNEAAINTQGGNTTLATGSWSAGSGGDVDFYSGDGFMSISGAINTSGGTSASGYGGSGGSVEFYIFGHGVIVNTAAFTANGGNGTDGGGNGGFVGMYVDEGGSTGAGSINNSGNITNKGGNATTGNAGGGGGVEIELGGESSINGDVTNGGVIDSSGGNSTSGNGGGGGYVLVGNSSSNGGPGDVTNTAALTNNGGSGAYGGAGGSIDLYNSPSVDGNDLTNSGALSSRGGAGTTDGGGGGYIYLYADHVTNSGNINTSGGNGTAGYGGNAADVYMNPTPATTNTTANTGTVTANGGTGALGDGIDGVFTKDGVVQ